MPSTLIALDFYLVQIAKEILGKEAAGRWHFLVSLEDIPKSDLSLYLLTMASPES